MTNILPHKGDIAALPVGVYLSPIHNGLRLTIRPRAKAWVLRRRSPTTGKLVQEVLGHHPTMDHIAAVQAAVTVRASAHNNSAVRGKSSKPVTLQAVVDHYELTYLRVHRKNPRPIAALLNRHLQGVSPHSGDNLAPFASIPASLSRKEAHAILATFAPTPASQRVFKIEMQAAFNHAMLTELLPESINPWQGLKTKPFGIRQRVLSDTELAALFKWLPSVHATLRDVLTLSLLTLARSGECCGARWCDIDLEHGTWCLPGTSTKNGIGRTVMLSPPAIQVLRSRANNGSAYVFPSTQKQDASIAQHCVVNALCGIRDKCPVAHFSCHDARRTAASHLAMMGAPENLIEVGLGHQRGQLVRTYQVYSYAKELRTWLDALGC